MYRIVCKVFLNKAIIIKKTFLVSGVMKFIYEKGLKCTREGKLFILKADVNKLKNQCIKSKNSVILKDLYWNRFRIIFST